MDSSHLDQAEKSSPDTFPDSPMSADTHPPDNNGIIGDPLVHPRVGDEYQVEIPSILSKSQLFELMKNPSDLGLPTIPVMWSRNKVNVKWTERLQNLDDPEKLANIQNSSDMKEHVKVDVLDAPNQTSVSKGHWLVPGKPTESWSDFEADCFLLGLYMLGKNLLQVTRFVESKSLGEILTYYYGHFYASPGYSRWSECRKMKSRKCVIGHRFFTGHRQQELFSRLFACLSEECKNKLLEASKAFAEGSSSLDEYVFTLKSTVGTHALVGAVGIGKGKEDLTTLSFDGSKNNQNFPHRPEVPSGKACSTLTCSEIVKYLKGDFRLSKARSNDLFWEAVWPRLLARGWHSEQPTSNNGYKCSNHLVFLVPGIKKFSRRKLSKGEQYFDSVSDLLAKVASEPQLLQLESDETNCRENRWETKVKVKSDDDQDFSDDHERHCYLKPRFSFGMPDLTMFTIVDTSLASEDKPYNVWELRSLPVESEKRFPLSCQETKLQLAADVLPKHSKFSDHSREQPSDDVKSKRIFMPMNHDSTTIKQQFSRPFKHGISNCGGTITKKPRLSSCIELDKFPSVLSLPAKNRSATLRIIGPKLSKTDVKLTSEILPVSDNHTEKQDFNLPQVPIEPKNDCKVKLIEVDNVLHFEDMKSRLSSEDTVRLSDGMEPRVSSEDTAGLSDNMEPRISSEDTIGLSDNMQLRVSSEVTIRLSDNMESQVSPEDTVGVSDNMDPCLSSTSSEPSIIVSKDTAGPSVIMDPHVSCASGEPEAGNKAVKSDEQPRRQSTRNRPLTTKALEALEFGFLCPVRQYKKRSPFVAPDQKPKRASHQRNKSPMFPHDTIFEMENYNDKTDKDGQAPIGSTQSEKEMLS